MLRHLECEQYKVTHRVLMQDISNGCKGKFMLRTNNVGLFISDVLHIDDVCCDGMLQYANVSLLQEASLFAEHFPSKPILPGALTFGIVCKLAELFFKKNNFLFVLQSIEKISFLQPILPIYKLSIVLKFEQVGSDKMKAIFVVKNEITMICSRGALNYCRGKL